MRTISCSGYQNGAPAHCSSRRRAGLRSVVFILTVLLTLAMGSVPALADDALFQPAVNYSAGDGSCSLAVGDFNGDSEPDLVVVSRVGKKVSILLGQGDGTFAAAVDYDVVGWPTSVAVGDFNDDRRPDLVMTDNSNSISVLLGQGYGTFAAAVSYDVGSMPYSVAVGDFDADGKPDLAVANNVGNNVSILLGQGDGTFDAAANYDVGKWPNSVAVGDFNGDGKPDLAVANNDDHNVSVLLGGGDGTFAAAVNYASGFAPYSVAVGDFNGDGKPDLAVANEGDNNVSIMLGQGDGTFDAAASYGTGYTPRSIAVGDFNSDGRPDLAVANYADSNVSILLGQGDGTFAAAVSYGTGNGSYSVAVGDFNGDGQPDLAVVNADDDNVSVLLNNTKLTSLNLTGAIPDLPARGSEYDLDNLPLTGQSQWGKTISIAGLPVTWACSGTTGSIRDGHYLKPLSPGSGGTVTATINGVTSNPLSFNVLPAVNNADLSDLTVTPGSISGFSPDTVTYAVIDSTTPASLTVTATADDDRSSLTIGGRSADSGIPQTVSLDNGANLIPIVVTAADGQTQKAYVLSVNGTVNDANLGSLSVSTGSLSFDPSVVTYDLGGVASSESGLDITVSPHDPRALVLLNGSPVQAGVAKTVNLAYGANNIDVMVVAQDATTKTYAIGVTRGRPSIAWDAGSLQASDISATGLTLTWPAASCDAGISGYNIYQGAYLLSTVADSVYSYNAAGLTRGTTYDFSVRAADTAGSLSSPLTLSIRTGSGLGITTAMLTGATVSRAYSAALEAGGGKAPYTWSATGLPAGLALDSAAGTITGTPTAAGTSVVNVTLTDSSGLSTSKGFILNVFYPAGTGKYTITPVSGPEITAGTTEQGIATLTVNSGVTGFKCFEVNVATVESHTGNEAVVFVQVRSGVQIAINATKADFDRVNSAMAAFNVQPGDIIKVCIVDDLTNDTGSNPTLLQ